MGCYYMTVPRDGEFGEGKVFSSPMEVFLAFSLKAVGIHARIKVRLPPGKKVVQEEGKDKFQSGGLLETTTGRVLFNEILNPNMPFYNQTNGQKQLAGIIADCYRLLGRRETIDLLDRMKETGFREATRSGLSFATDDLKTPDNKVKVIAEAEKKVLQHRRNYQRGIITDSERHNNVLDAWTHARDEITKAMMLELKDDQRRGEQYLNPIYLMAHSGARGGVDQIRQLAGMRGLMAKPSGAIIEEPIKANFRSGLSVSSTSVDAWCPQGVGRHGSQDRRLGLPHPEARRRRPKRGDHLGRLRDDSRRHQGRDLQGRDDRAESLPRVFAVASVETISSIRSRTRSSFARTR